MEELNGALLFTHKRHISNLPKLN